MFREVLLGICVMFIVANTVLMIIADEATGRFGNFMQAVIYGLMFYYIWVT